MQDAQISFGRRRLWSDVSFELSRGQMAALVGPSGSGKTTLLNCIGLLEKLDRGTIRYNGVNAARASSKLRRKLYRDTIGFLFQNSGLVDSWTVYENVVIALSSSHLTRRNKRERVEAVTKEVGLQPSRLGDRVYTLSGGEQQRVGLARLLLSEASVVLADEPTASLDSDNASMVIDSLRALSDRGAAVLISTHDERVLDAVDLIVDFKAPSRELGSSASVRASSSA
ncbi:MAG: ATP-binding cassette domain-containing protein [Microbacterium gubbeenense]|uniref:ATP-binding cassette domain-containing protein n=1 Tax=Microbacterium gubbeenense TaxID=159896 RepID=UPI003F9AA083